MRGDADQDLGADAEADEVIRSSSERGRSAERIPIGIDTSSQMTMPPKTSDAVTGAAIST